MREADPPEEPRPNGFDVIVAKNLRNGLYVCQLKTLLGAVNDPA